MLLPACKCQRAASTSTIAARHSTHFASQNPAVMVASGEPPSFGFRLRSTAVHLLSKALHFLDVNSHHYGW